MAPWIPFPETHTFPLGNTNTFTQGPSTTWPNPWTTNYWTVNTYPREVWSTAMMGHSWMAEALPRAKYVTIWGAQKALYWKYLADLAQKEVRPLDIRPTWKPRDRPVYARRIPGLHVKRKIRLSSTRAHRRAITALMGS